MIKYIAVSSRYYYYRAHSAYTVSPVIIPKGIFFGHGLFIPKTCSTNGLKVGIEPPSGKCALLWEK